MSTAPSTGSGRRSAAERREEIVAVAFRHFALGGYHGTSTEPIAAEAGISQPYLFRLFRTKRELFLACCELCHDRVRTAFATAAEAVPPDERLQAMGSAYMDLLADEHALRFQLQMYAACSDPVVRAQARDGYRDLVEVVRERSGASEADVWSFFATGMMLNVVASLSLAEIADEDPWAAAWSDPRKLMDPGEC